MIKEEGNSYVVYSKAGKRLGEHATKKDAMRQLAAIEMAKAKRTTALTSM